jgi:hypothetical protein
MFSLSRIRGSSLLSSWLYAALSLCCLPIGVALVERVANQIFAAPWAEMRKEQVSREQTEREQTTDEVGHIAP